MSDLESIHSGGCFCKAVRYQVEGRPILSAYCHCTLCQRLHAATFILTIHFPASSFTWTHAQPHDDSLAYFDVPEKPWKRRWRCKKCGCTVASFNSQAKKWSVWGTQLDRSSEGKIIGWDSIQPTAHIFYETHIVEVKDDLGKWTGYEEKSERIS